MRKEKDIFSTGFIIYDLQILLSSICRLSTALSVAISSVAFLLRMETFALLAFLQLSTKFSAGFLLVTQIQMSPLLSLNSTWVLFSHIDQLPHQCKETEQVIVTSKFCTEDKLCEKPFSFTTTSTHESYYLVITDAKRLQLSWFFINLI